MATLQTLVTKFQGDASGLNQTFDQAEKRTSGFKGLLNSALGTAMGFAGAQAAIGLVGRGFDMVKGSIIGTNAQLETSELQFTTLMGSADKAHKQVAMLFEFAKKTPFETGEVIEASRSLQTFGGAALNTQKTLTLVGDAAGAVSAPFNEVAFWTGRMYSAIKAGRPFGEAAARLQELAILSPKARDEMEKMQKAGKSSSEVWSVMEKDLGKFNGAMEKQATTWSGLTSTLSDVITLTAANALKPFFTLAKSGITLLINLLSSPKIEKGAQYLAKSLGSIFTRMTTGWKTFYKVAGKPFLDLIAGWTKTGMKLVGFIRQDFGRGLDYLSDKGHDLLDAFKVDNFNAFDSVLIRVRKTLFDVQDGVGPLGERMDTLRKILFEVKNLFSVLGGGLATLASLTLPLLTRAWDALVGIFNSLKTPAGDFLDKVLAFVGDNGLPALTRALDSLLTKAAEFLRWLNSTDSAAGKVRKTLGFLLAGLAGMLVMGPVVGALSGVAGSILGVGRAATSVVTGPLKTLARPIVSTVKFAAQGAEKVLSTAKTITGLAGKVVSTGVRFTQAGGSAILDVLTKLAGYARDGVKVPVELMGDAARQGESFATNVVGGLIGGFIGAAPELAAAIGGLFAEGGLLAGVGAGLVAAAPLVVIGLVAAIVAFFPTQIGYIAGAITGLFIQAVTLLVGAVASIVAPIGQALFDAIGSVLGTLGKFIGELLSGQWDKAWATFVGAIKGLFIDFPLNILHWFQSAIPKVISGLGEMAGKFVDTIMSGLNGILPSIQKWVSDISGGFGSGFSQWIGDAGRQALAFVGAIMDEIFKIPGKLADFFSNQLLPALAKWINGLLAAAKNLAYQIVKGLFDAAQGLMSLPGKLWTFLTKDFIPGLARWAGTLLDNAVKLGGQIVKGFIDGLASLPGRVADAIGDVFRNLNLVIGPFHITGQGVWVQVDLPKFDLPKFAVGAWNLPRDMAAIVHKGEMIIPARLARMLRGEGGVGEAGFAPLGSLSTPGLDSVGSRPPIQIFNFRIDNLAVRSRDDIDELSDAIALKVRLASG